MNQSIASPDHVETPHVATRGNIPLLVMATVWMLIIFTFNVPDRADGATIIDAIALLKVGCRALSLSLLVTLLWWQWKPERGRLLVQCMLPLGCFVAWGILSVVWSPLKTVSLGQLGSFVVLLLLAANIALSWKSEFCTSRVLFHLSMALLFFNGFMIFAKFALADLGSVVRTQDSFIHATMASSNASMGVLILLGARIVWGWRWSRLLFVPGMAVHCSQLYIAHSRTAVAATLLAALLMYIVFVNRHIIWACLFALCVGAGLYLTFDPGLDLADSMMSSGTTYVHRDENASLSSMSGREEMWDEMWKSFQTSPWIGHGYFVSSANGELYVWYEYGNWTAHNLLLQALVTTGLIGTIILAWGIGRPARVMLSTMEIDHQHRALVLFLLVLSSWFFVWGLMNESILGPLQPESVVFFSMLGLGMGSALCAVAKSQHPAHAASLDSLRFREPSGAGHLDHA